MKSGLRLDNPSEFEPDDELREKDRVQDFLSWYNSAFNSDLDRAFMRLAALSFYVGWEVGFWDTYRKAPDVLKKLSIRALNAGKKSGSVRAETWVPED